MAISPLDVKQQKGIFPLKREIKERNDRIISIVEKVIDNLLFLKNDQLKKKKYIIISRDDIENGSVYKKAVDEENFSAEGLWNNGFILFRDGKLRDIIAEKYAQIGWMVQYKGIFNKYFEFTPLPKSSQEIEKNRFSNLDID